MNFLPYWLASLFLPEIGPKTMLRWLEHFPTIEALFTATEAEWTAANIAMKHQELLRQPNWKAVENELAWAQKPSHRILCLDDDDYPSLLKEIADPPLVLYVWGEVAALSQSQLAMVGSRQASPAGLMNAEQFAFYLAEAGLTITSGLALGVDAASHRGALAANGKTIGVMGTGMNHIYPYSHRSLAQEMVKQGGAIISEFPLETLAKPPHFPRRNRVIAGLSLGVLVVEAALRSGSLTTARHANEQGREVFAIPGSIHHTQARGCHHLIQEGAKLVETAQDIMSELQITSSKPGHTLTRQNQPKTVPAHPLIAQIDYAATSMDMIILRSGLTAGEVSSILLTLDLQGYIRAVPGGYVRVGNHS